MGTPGELAFYRSLHPAVLAMVLPVVAVVLWVLIYPVLQFVHRHMFSRTVEDATLANQHYAWIGAAVSKTASALKSVGTTVGSSVAGFVGALGSGLNANLLGYLWKGLAFILLVVLLFILIMFIFFSQHTSDLNFGTNGSGTAKFLNAFNYNDWILFRWREWWPVRATNEFLNPYRRTLSPEAIQRGLLPAGRCDGVTYVSDGAGRCAASVKPSSIVWPLSFPEGNLVPGVLRQASPAHVLIPYVEEGDRFVASCDVRLPPPSSGGDGAPLLAPVAGDSNRCALARAPNGAFTDAYRPKRGASAFAGLDAYASASAPLC